MSHVSFSELKEWTTCPWKHKLNYIDKIKQFKGNEYTAFGTALHTICEKLVQLDVSKSESNYDPKEDFQIEFLQNLQKIKNLVPDIEFNKKLITSMRSQADHIIQYILPALKSYFGKFKLVEVEEKLYEHIEDQNQKYKGFIDLVIYTPKDKKYHIKKNNVEIFKVSNGTKKIENALKLLNKALYNINKKNHLKNRLSCHGRYGMCEYYKSEYCK